MFIVNCQVFVSCYRQLQRLESKLSSDITMILSLLQQQQPHSQQYPQRHPASPSGSAETIHDETRARNYSDIASHVSQNTTQQTLVDLEDRGLLGDDCDKGLEKSQKLGCSSTQSLQV